MKFYIPTKIKFIQADAFQKKANSFNHASSKNIFNRLKYISFIFIFILFSSTFANAQNYNTNTEMYIFTNTPKAFEGLQIPDFLAFATENKEMSTEKFIGPSFYPDSISVGFAYSEDYAKYASKEAEYLKLLEQAGFEYRTAWEGYTHYQKQWNGYYVLVTSGISYYEDDKESFLISISLTEEPRSFPF